MKFKKGTFREGDRVRIRAGCSARKGQPGTMFGTVEKPGVKRPHSVVLWDSGSRQLFCPDDTLEVIPEVANE
jgi:hypothetical protein